MTTTDLAPSAVALSIVLSEDGQAARAITARFHRTLLWRLTTGRGLPDLATATELETLSGGRIDATKWIRDRAA